MSFPDNLIRGIPNSTYLNSDGSVGSHLFYFNEGTVRNDGWTDLSVNWEDRDSVVEFTLNQRKDDKDLQFKGGVTVIPREEVDRLNNRPIVKGLLSYERQPTPDNPYHGNILLRVNTPKPTMKLIAGGLALAISRVVTRR
jgi:hypothetical protein